MLHWLDRIYRAAKGAIPKPIRDWVHHMVRAVAGIMNTVFGHVGDAWNDMVRMAEASFPGLKQLGDGIEYFVKLLWNKWLPAIRRWASKWISRVEQYAKNVYHWAVRELDRLRKAAWKWVQDALRWVIDHVWKPLYGWVRDLYKKMADWAYTAWWYITHPDKLAERLFWFIIDLVKRYVWDLAKIFGEFLARLFLANVPRVVKLIETIMADVL